MSAANDFVLSNDAITVAIFSTVIAVCISGFSIYQHLINYTCPDQQRYIIRLLFTCPLYAVTSLLSLRFSKNAIYFETLRDCYESLVVYTFMVLILEYAGGEGNCVTKMQGRPPLQPPFPCCFMDPRPRTVELLRECKRGTLQFVVIKPVAGILSIIMVSQDLYYNPVYQTLMLTVYNISYTVALYYLLVFYLATKEACANYYPVSKFAAVKTVVFATYYQGMLIRCMGMPNELAEGWSDFILCVEMILFAFMLSCAFTKEPYDLGVDNTNSVGRARTVMQSASNVLAVQDMMQDAYHNFMPAYQDYLLQREDINTVKKVRRRIKFPGSKTATTPDNQLLLTGLCWGVDTCMSLEIRAQEVTGEGLNKNGFFSIKGSIKTIQESESSEKVTSTSTSTTIEIESIDSNILTKLNDESTSSKKTSKKKSQSESLSASTQSLELEVTNDFGTVPLVLKSHIRRPGSMLPLNLNIMRRKMTPADIENQIHNSNQSQLPASWRGKSEDGGDAVFDSMTEVEARKFTAAMSDTDSRDNQIQEEDRDSIELGIRNSFTNTTSTTQSAESKSSETMANEEEENYDREEATAKKYATNDEISPPLILPPPVRKNPDDEDVAFSPFHSTLPPPTVITTQIDRPKSPPSPESSSP